MDQAKPFKVGDRVVHHYGIRGKFVREDVVTKVHKTSNFKISKSDTQFRQGGGVAGDPNAWSRGWVEHWTPDLGKLVERSELEAKVSWNLKLLMNDLGNVSDESLGRLNSLLENIKSNKDAV
jgi:hypothetical protein